MTGSPTTVHHVTVDYEWALEGKPPGSYNDYEVLEHSRGLDLRIFDEIRSRYATGASGDQPQVTIAFAGTRQPDGADVYYIVLALQNEWSGHRDGTNRKIFYTRWYYVPYDQIAGHRVSYEALYDAFKDLGDNRPTTIAVRAYADLPAKLYGDALGAAGLLLTGKHVCVVGADQEPLRKRLQFIDEVASLLPYGMRTRLTAATWVSATADHKIRLSFAPHAADRTHKVTWNHGVEIPAGERVAGGYVKLLQNPRISLGELVERLARISTQISFTPNGFLKALNALEDCANPDTDRNRPEIPEPEPPVKEDLPQHRPSPPPLPPPGGGEDAPTAPARSPLILESLIGGLKNARQDSEVADRLRALLEAVDHDEARVRLQSALYENDCFTAVIGPHGHPEPRYTDLAKAAFTAGTCRTAIADELLKRGSTPRQVKRVIRQARHPGDWWQRVLPGKTARVVSGLAVLAVGGGLLAFASLGLFTGSGQVAPPPGWTAPVGVPAAPSTVVVQAGQDDRYLAHIYAGLLRNLGQPAEVRDVGALDAAQPRIVITTDSGRYPGYQPLLDTQSVRLALVIDSDKVKSGELDEALEKGTRSVAVHEDFPDEAKLKKRYGGIELVRMPADSVLGALKKGDVSIAILPAGLPEIALPLQQVSVLDDVLPQRSIHVLSAGLSTATATSLGGVSDILAEKWRAGAGGADPEKTAREFADSLVPPVVTPSDPAPLQVTPAAETEASGGSLDSVDVFLFVAALLILAGGLILLFRFSAYAPDDPRR